MQKTPHELLTGMNPQINIQLIKENVPAAIHRLQQLVEARQLAQSHPEWIQQAKDNKMPQLFTEGQQVWLEGKNLSIKGSQKLSPKQYRPFPIKEKVLSVVYWLELPQSMKIHDIFHIDLLTPYKEIEAYGMPFTRPPPMIENKEEEYEIELILDTDVGENSNTLSIGKDTPTPIILGLIIMISTHQNY